MSAPIFPIFSLKTFRNYVIVGGGGGNQDFGKKNGVVILDETTYKDLAYFETEDIITTVYISEGEISLEEEDIDWTEDETANKSNDTIIPEKGFYIGCRGLSAFYICKFEDDKINQVAKIEKAVDNFVFKKHLIFIADKQIFTAYDAISNKKSLSKLAKSKKPLPEGQEEYIYALKKAGEKIQIEREEGKTDVPDTWKNFFIVTNRIHKITNENNGYCFVFDGKKYFYEREIGDIAYLSNDSLVYYLKGNDSTLKFLSNKEKSFEIQKITCLNVDNKEFVCVGTADGKGYLFKDSKIYCIKKLCDFPITGISYTGGYFYYSSFNGLVSRKKAFSLIKMVFLIGGLLVLLLAVIYKIYLRSEDYIKGGNVL